MRPAALRSGTERAPARAFTHYFGMHHRLRCRDPASFLLRLTHVDFEEIPRIDFLFRFMGVEPAHLYGFGSCSAASIINHASTFWRAQGVFRRKVRLDFTLGSWRKQRIGMRRPISAQPCFSTNFFTMVSSVMPCSGSRG